MLLSQFGNKNRHIKKATIDFFLLQEVTQSIALQEVTQSIELHLSSKQMQSET